MTRPRRDTLRIQRLEQRMLLAADPVLYQVHQPDPLNDRSLAAEIGDATVFLHDDGLHGREVWTTKGSQGTAELLLDLRHGPDSSNVKKIHRVGNHVYFLRSDSDNSVQIWRTDGTSEGTELFAIYRRPDVETVRWEGNTDTGIIVSLNSPTGSSTQFLPIDGRDSVHLTAGFSEPWSFNLYHAEGNRLLYAEGFGAPRSLWISDGTSSKTVQVTDYDYVGNNIRFNGLPKPLVHNDSLFLSFNEAENFTPVLQHISSEGTTQNLTLPSNIQSIDSLIQVGGRNLVKTSFGDTYVINDDFSVTPFITRINSGTRAIESLVAYGEDYYFIGETSNSTARLFRFQPSLNIVSEVSEAGNLHSDVFSIDEPLKFAGNWIVYFKEGSPLPQLRTLHLGSHLTTRVGEIRRIPHPQAASLTFDERYGFIATAPNRIFSQVISADSQTLRLDDLSRPPGPDRTLFSLTTGLLEISDLRSVGSDAVNFTLRTDTDWLRIQLDLRTGETNSIISQVGNLNAALIDEIPGLTQLVALNATRLSYQGENRIWVTDGTKEGTEHFPSHSAKNRFVSPKILPDGTHTYYHDLDSTVPIIGVPSSSGNPFASESIGPITSVEAPEVANDIGNGLLYMKDGDVWRINNASFQEERLIENYADRAITPLASVDRTGDDPFRFRVTEVTHPDGEAFTSDGTLDRTGLVDSISAIRQRVEQIEPIRSWSSIDMQQGAFHTRITTDTSNIQFVERPTEQFLQPFFPLDQPSNIERLNRIDFAWLAFGRYDGSAQGWWVFPDDEDQPRQLTIGNTGFQGAFGGKLLLSHSNQAANVASDLTSVDPISGSSVAFSQVANWQGDDFRAAVVGTVDGETAIATNTTGEDGSLTFWTWDGTSGGATQLTSVELLTNQIPRLAAWQYDLQATDEAYWLSTPSETYRIAHSERTIHLDGNDREINFTANELLISSDLLAGSDERTVGQHLTIDTRSSDSRILVTIDGVNSLPLNGTKIWVAPGAEIELQASLVGSSIQYEQSWRGMTIVIAGRRLEIVGDTFRINDSLDVTQREFVMSSMGMAVTLGDNGGVPELAFGVGNHVNHDVLLGGTLVPLRIISRAANQSANLLSSFDGATNLEFIHASPAGDSLRTDVQAEGFEFRSIDRLISGPAVMVQKGAMNVRLDVRHNLTHNPLRPHDTNADDDISALDALQIINHLSRINADPTFGFFPDVNDDGLVTALDALQVINQLARVSADSELVVTPERIAAIDSIWSQSVRKDQSKAAAYTEDFVLLF